ncbi:hypothetical protein NL108_017418 [Boleophthalmus pectinirostris]|nr:hypothetical protein NL108_017418 [Boleophthalmus pectinirostris]
MVVPVDISALLRAEPEPGEDGLCVVGLFGKSDLRPESRTESLVDALLDRRAFPPFDAGNGGGIRAVHEPERRVLYLLMSSACDGRELLRACAAVSANGAHADAHELWKSLERERCLHLLFLFSVCHVLLLVHPNHTFDVTYDRVFRAVDALRQKVLPLLRAAIKDCAVSKEWKVNCRACPPRVLFVFHMNGSLKVCSGADSVPPVDKPKRPSPRRRLQHALEDQIYRIFRKSRVLTNQSSNCLFTVPANQAFVYVAPAAEEDAVGALLGQLRSHCALGERDPASGPGRYRPTRRSARAPAPRSRRRGPSPGPLRTAP